LPLTGGSFVPDSLALTPQGEEGRHNPSSPLHCIPVVSGHARWIFQRGEKEASRIEGGAGWSVGVALAPLLSRCRGETPGEKRRDWRGRGMAGRGWQLGVEPMGTESCRQSICAVSPTPWPLCGCVAPRKKLPSMCPTYPVSTSSSTTLLPDTTTGVTPPPSLVEIGIHVPSCHFPSSTPLHTVHSPRPSRWPHPYCLPAWTGTAAASCLAPTDNPHPLTPRQLGSATYTAYEWEVRNGVGHKWIVKKR
jgi:hypothetical protein